jgi:transposase
LEGKGSVGAEALMGDAKCERVIADKGYASDAFRECVAQRGATAVIPPKANRKKQYWYDKYAYGEL